MKPHFEIEYETYDWKTFCTVEQVESPPAALSAMRVGAGDRRAVSLRSIHRVDPNEATGLGDAVS